MEMASGSFLLKKELADFFEEQIDRIGRAQVKLKPITFKEVLVSEDDSSEKTEIVASMRSMLFCLGSANKAAAKSKDD